MFPSVWEETVGQLPKDSIRGRRYFLLYERLFGLPNDFVSESELISVQKLMSDVVTPYYVDGKPFFPILLLDNFRGAKNYVDALQDLVTKDRASWPAELDIINNNKGLSPTE